MKRGIAGLGLAALALAGCRDFGAAYQTWCQQNGCDGGGPGGDGGPGNDGGPGDAGPVVTLTVVDHYLTGTGVVDVPWDGGVSVFVGGAAVPATSVGPGVYRFSAAPGTAYLAGRNPPGYNHPIFVAAKSSALDLGEYNPGRPNAAIASGGTIFDISATGLVTWDVNDVLEISCPGAGITGQFLYIPNYPPTANVVNPPANGAQSLSNMQVPWDGLQLIDSTQGDQAIIYQLANAATGGTQYVHIAAWIDMITGNQVVLANASTTALTGTFATLTGNIVATVNYDRSGFAAVTPAEPSGSVVSGGETYFVEAIYGGLGYGRYDPMPDLAVSFIDAGAGQVVENLSFGNPFQGSQWALGVLAGQLSQTEFMGVLDGGASYDSFEETDITIQIPFDAGTTTITPLVAPPTGLSINGSLATNQTIPSTGMAPLVSWSAGSLNPPSYYAVVLRQITDANAPVSVVGVLTPDLQVRLPPGFLVAGNVYVLRIGAVYDPNGGWPARGLVTGYPYGSAQAVTRAFSP